MAKYIVKRLLMSLIVLAGVLVITFFITRYLPSDPARAWAGLKATEEQVAMAEEELGLNKPKYEQFIDYLKDLAKGDLGISYSTRRPVVDEMKEAIPATLELVFYGMVMGILLGIALGVLSAKYKNRLADHLIRLFSISTVSIPTFVLSILCQLIFYSILGILPLGGRLDTIASLTYNCPQVTGWFTIDSLLAGNIPMFKDAVLHLILPALAISAYPAGSVARMTRSTLVEVLNEDYITAARSYGIKERKILWSDALKNSIGTTATSAALAVGYTIVGTFLTESIFSWPGIGKFMSESITRLDYPSIIGTTLFSTVVYLLLNVVADLIVALDPRIRI